MLNNDVFYTKYRPKQLTQVIGQDIVTKILTKSCEKESFHHSYLLCGKHGTGKTTIGRIIATLLTCENRTQGSSIVCGKCDACLSVHSGNSLDVYELDGASNSKVENTRSIIESSRYAPQQFKKRVFIIDECHKLSNTAMTSLLKTLEEPSPTSVFILCTTDFVKIPKEIVSRCQRLHFKPVSANLISSYLEQLFRFKKIEVEKSAVDLIATSCGGSVRDALQLAQSACVLSDNKITEKTVADLLGVSGREMMYNIVDAISTEDLFKAMDILETMFSSNVDCRSVCDDLESIFRTLMLSTISEKFLYEITATEKKFIDSVKGKFKREHLVSFLSIFEEAQRALNVNINNKWVMEATLVKIIDRISDK